MKIGILTQPLLWNYGGILQNYALQTVLIRMGHDAVTIDRRPTYVQPSFIFRIKLYLKYLIKSLFKEAPSQSWSTQISEEIVEVLTLNTSVFINKHIKRTEKTISKKLSDIEAKYKFDAYVVGSDQVWVPSYSLESFLNFVNRKDVIKVAYAASCGNDSWMDYDILRDRCIKLASSFSGISVREDYLLDKVSFYLGNHIRQVLDPTMLLSKDDYFKLFKSNSAEVQPYIFSYILDTDCKKSLLVHEIANKLGLPIKEGNPKIDYRKVTKRTLNSAIFPPVENWLSGLANASFVITDSFHGTAFSILFNKKFGVFGNEGRGIKRQESILKLFGLSNRVIHLDAPIEVTNILEDINYSNVNKIIDYYRKESLDFLNVSLNSTEKK